VLRLWPEPVTVGLFPDRVLALRYKSRLLRNPEAQSAVCLPAPLSWGAASTAWMPSVADAVQMLDLSRRGAVTVLLSNHFVRYQILPWSESLVRSADWIAYAQHKFSKAYGEEAAGWDIRVSTEGARMPRLASAIPAGMHHTLKSGLQSAGVTLVSLQPAWMGTIERVRKSLKDEGPKWVIAHEPGVLAFGMYVDRQWRSIRLRKAGENWLDEVPVILDREMHLVGMPESIAELWLDAPCEESIPSRLGDYVVLNAGRSISSVEERSTGHALIRGTR
jgi:hypothetical protein